MSAASNATVQLLNPYTPMAFFTPDLARDVTIALYVLVGSLAVLIWDIILHLPQDYELLMRYRINFSFVIYCFSRIITLIYLAGFVIVQTAPVGDCTILHRLQALYPLTVPITILLFVFRVSALYNNNKYVVAFFTLSWLSVFVSSVTLPIGAAATNIGTTKYCIQTQLAKYIGINMILTLLNDTMVFFATSAALMKNAYKDVTIQNGLMVVLIGKDLPAFSKNLLRDGQAYYLATHILKVLLLVFFYTPSVPLVWTSIVGIPNFVLVNNMTCYVYRNIRFKFYRDETIRTTAINKPRHNTIGQPRSELVFKSTATATNTSAQVTETSYGIDLEGSQVDSGVHHKIGGGYVVELDLLESHKTEESKVDGDKKN